MNLRSQFLGFYLPITVTLIFACGGENFARIRNLHSSGETIICLSDSLTEGVGVRNDVSV